MIKRGGEQASTLYTRFHQSEIRKLATVSTLGQGSAYNLNVPGALYPAESSLQAAFPAEASTPERGNSPQRETLSTH